MAIRLKAHGVEFEVDSSQEAMEMYRLLAKNNGNVATTQLTNLGLDATRATEPQPTGNSILGNNAKKMIRILLAKPNGERSELVATQLGVNGAHGLAAINRQIRAFGRIQFNLTDEQCINTVSGLVSLSEVLASKIRGHEQQYLG